MFNVYTIVPSYNDRDAIDSWAAHVHPYAFHTKGGALASASLLAGDYDEVEVVVVPVGASPFDRAARVYRAFDQAGFDDLPF